LSESSRAVLSHVVNAAALGTTWIVLLLRRLRNANRRRDEGEALRARVSHRCCVQPAAARSVAAADGIGASGAGITDGPTVRDILDHLGEPTMPPRIAPARGPPLWAATGDAHDPSAAPPFEFDQRLSW